MRSYPTNESDKYNYNKYTEVLLMHRYTLHKMLHFFLLIAFCMVSEEMLAQGKQFYCLVYTSSNIDAQECIILNQPFYSYSEGRQYNNYIFYSSKSVEGRWDIKSDTLTLYPTVEYTLSENKVLLNPITNDSTKSIIFSSRKFLIADQGRKLVDITNYQQVDDEKSISKIQNNEYNLITNERFYDWQWKTTPQPF